MRLNSACDDIRILVGSLFFFSWSIWIFTLITETALVTPLGGQYGGGERGLQEAGCLGPYLSHHGVNCACDGASCPSFVSRKMGTTMVYTLRGCVIHVHA